MYLLLELCSQRNSVSLMQFLKGVWNNLQFEGRERARIKLSPHPPPLCSTSGGDVYLQSFTVATAVAVETEQQI